MDKWGCFYQNQGMFFFDFCRVLGTPLYSVTEYDLTTKAEKCDDIYWIICNYRNI